MSNEHEARVRAFVERWQEMPGQDPTVIYGIGDRDGESLLLRVDDLETLLAQVSWARELRDMWKDEAAKRGPSDQLFTTGVVEMLTRALDRDTA